MKTFKLKRRLVKKFLRVFITLFMCFSLVFSPIAIPFSQPVVVEASTTTAGKIASYLLSLFGVTNVASNGRVGRASGSLIDGLIERVSDALGNGVYVDSSGNYVFSNEFSQNILSYLTGQNSIDYRVLSDFNAPSNWDGIWENSQYMSIQFKNRFNEYSRSFSKYLCTSYCKKDTWSQGVGVVLSCTFYDMSNVAFISKVANGSAYMWQFYDNTLNPISVSYYSFLCAFRPDRGIINDSDVANSSSSVVQIMDNSNWVTSNPVPVRMLNFSCRDDTFVNLPFYKDPYGYQPNYEMDSNRSFIISNSVSAGNGAINRTTGNFVTNYYNTIPSVSETVINNNDWDNIYNNYITNVQNNYYEDNGGQENPIDINKLRKWMDKYNQSIIDAIENGDNNIAEQINYTNEWLNKVYSRLGIIQDLLENIESGSGASVGGGSSTWTDTDIDTLLQDINDIENLLTNNNSYILSLQNRIDITNSSISNASAILTTINTNTYNSVTQLQNLYTLLSNVYQQLLNGGGGGGSGGIPEPDDPKYDNWYDVLHDVPQVDLNNLFSKFDVLKTVLQNTAPFVMLGVITITINGFKATPVKPEFSIPFQFSNNIIDVDESIDIDLSVMDSVIPLLKDLILILWTIGLLMFAWWLVPKLYLILA